MTASNAPGSSRWICASCTVKVPPPLSDPISATGLRPVPSSLTLTVSRPASGGGPPRISSARSAAAIRRLPLAAVAAAPRWDASAPGAPAASHGAVDLVESEFRLVELRDRAHVLRGKTRRDRDMCRSHLDLAADFADQAPLERLGGPAGGAALRRADGGRDHRGQVD